MSLINSSIQPLSGALSHFNFKLLPSHYFIACYAVPWIATALSPEANDSFLRHHTKPLAFVDLALRIKTLLHYWTMNSHLHLCPAVLLSGGAVRGAGAVISVWEADVLLGDHFVCEVWSGPAGRARSGAHTMMLTKLQIIFIICVFFNHAVSC